MRVLVTGAGGLIGSHLVEALVARGDLVQGWGRHPTPETAALGASVMIADIADYSTVFRLLQDFAPDIVFHLAAQSIPAASWQDPAATYRTNVIGSINLLEAARQRPQPPRLLFAGSSAEYAEPDSGAALREDARLEPNSPYAASKAAMTELANLYARRYGLHLIVFRPFFLAGPRKVGDVCSDFARRIVAIERGAQNEMRVGTLEVVRDIMDVRDGVSALLRLADAGIPGEIYNIASGRGTSIQAVLDTYRSLAGARIEVIQDPALLRPLEQRVKIGDPTKLIALGWQPVHSLPDMLQNILNYWRSH